MYHKHNTEAIVIRGSERGEASKDVLLFSKEFGMIYASVQNGRSLDSKLRYGVQDFTIGNFVLVRGKHSWKMVGAEYGENLFEKLRSRITIPANIFSLLRKLLGEEKNEELYEIVLASLQALERAGEEEAKTLEFLTVLKILKNLGYLEESTEEIEILAKDRSRAIKTINTSLSAAQLTL